MSYQEASSTRNARIVAIFGVVILILATIAFVIGQTSRPAAAATPSVHKAPHATITVAPAHGSSDAATTGSSSTSHAGAATAAPQSKLTVWTAGFQTQINECRGAVDVTAHYGVRTVAEHWNCGGSALPTRAGTIVAITGLDAGTYRVVGVVATLDAYTAHTNQIPRGYSLLLQTCLNNDSHSTEFIALTRLS